MALVDTTHTVEEEVKRGSDHLRGDLATDLSDTAPKVSDGSAQLLKFHGVYAQDNRDVRRERSLAGEVLDYIFMVRVAIPGGQLSSEQWLALDEVASTLADGSIRLTTRQAVQFHGVVKHGLRPLVRDLDARLMTSFGACGDVVRNTVMCHELARDPRMSAMAERIARHFKPTTTAYWEIFVDGDRAASRESVAERPFYGDDYLPRKFKLAIANPDENCVDVLTQDLGLIPATHPTLGEGFTVTVAGGLGHSYAHPDTFSRLADPLTFVTDDEVDDVIAAVLATFHDLGGRSDRRRARLKYVAADLGIERLRAEIEARYGKALRPFVAFTPRAADDHLGWRRAGEVWQRGVRVEAGRVRDSRALALRSALRTIASEFSVTFFITAQQDLVISGVADDDRGVVDEILAARGVRPAEVLGKVERTALACPALPTCGQALTEAERRLPELVNLVENELDARAPRRRSLQLRMTGCPNGCARPAVAEVGVVGRTKNTYDLYLGGGTRGDRLAALYREKLKLEEIPGVLAPLLERWEDEGDDGESFGDFFARVHEP